MDGERRQSSPSIGLDVGRFWLSLVTLIYLPPLESVIASLKALSLPNECGAFASWSGVGKYVLLHLGRIVD